MTNKAQKFWDKQAKRYDAAELKFDHVYREMVSRTRKYLNANDNVLDFGCATGTKTIELSDKVRHIHGLDISAGMIREAMKKKDALKIPNISFSSGTIYGADLEKASFDKIIAYGILHLLEDKDTVVQRIHELLKPGGLFISTTACMRDKMPIKKRLEVTTYVLMNRLGLSPLYLNLFTTGDVEELMEVRKFQIIEKEKIVEGIPAVFIVARK
jgi:ubiquinone/menaquinone biosynthesis C-methylase UbiE